MDALLNNNAEYVNPSKCSLFELNGIAHGDFGMIYNDETECFEPGIVHPSNPNIISKFYYFYGNATTQNKGLKDLILEKLN